MGPTGSGKTTLLNALANRIKYTGDIYYGSYTWSKAQKGRVGFVEQDDICFDDLTVKQSLMFTALLRLPADMTLEMKEARVDNVIKEIRLTKCMHTKVGDSNGDRGISGGERKRLCIAAEFITKPHIIFFDEPTSGLDSTTALLVMEAMQTIAKSGVCVLSSIHQPSSQIFNLFGHLILLDGGEILYKGAAAEALCFFSKLGFQCPSSYNPPDFMMEVLVMNKFEPKQRESVIESFRVPSTLDFKPMVLLESKELRYVNGWSMQVWILTQRSYIIVRAGLLTKESVALYLGLSAIAGMLWLDVGTHEDDIFPRTTLALWMIGTWMFFPVFDSLALFSKGKDSLKKELHVNRLVFCCYHVPGLPAVFGVCAFCGGFFTLHLFFLSRTVTVFLPTSCHKRPPP
jgi:ABC-type multidrug transport system ATPase subunit